MELLAAVVVLVSVLPLFLASAVKFLHLVISTVIIMVPSMMPVPLVTVQILRVVEFQYIGLVIIVRHVV